MKKSHISKPERKEQTKARNNRKIARKQKRNWSE